MKQLNLAMIFIAVLTLLPSSRVNAQDENNPWVVGFGVNVVDIRIPSEFGDYAQDYIGTSEWSDNLLPSISRVSVEKYLADGFTLQLAGSINKIKHYAAAKDINELYWSADLNVKWDFNHLIGDTGWWDPYVYVGGGYTDFGRLENGNFQEGGEGTLNVGAGFNVWFNENIGLNFQTGAKKEFADKIQDHFQHSLGVVFRFGGKDTDGDGVYDKKMLVQRSLV